MRKIIPVAVSLLMVVLIAGWLLAWQPKQVHSDTFTDVAVLSTTDMHGKCWEKDLLNDMAVTSNMLRVAGAVDGVRNEFGKENVLLIDNGDIFQGTAISEAELIKKGEFDPKMPPVMALCLKEIGYDAFIPGNHEFDFALEKMNSVYRYLEDSGVNVVAANIVYSEDTKEHSKGENAFTPYITKTVTVNGHEHKIGILGLENTDITRWEAPERYAGLQFSHPGNEERLIEKEAEPYLAQMKDEGCEFIIVSYHAGPGDENDSGATNNQGRRLIEETSGIDMLILGHDHYPFAELTMTNKDGREVTAVNGGGSTLTQTVFRFTEDENGDLSYEKLPSESIELAQCEPDAGLQKTIQPYADLVEKEMSRPVGTLVGSWDENSNYYLEQTDTIDFICAALLDSISRYHKADMVIESCGVSNGYVLKAGDVCMKDFFKVVKYRDAAVLLPLSGRKIREIMEETASERLACRVLHGKACYYTKGDYYTNLFFGGLNYRFDMSAREGERVIIDGFSDGRPFDEDATYSVITTSYLLGNVNCGLRDCSDEDVVWSQVDGDPTGSVQKIMAEYVRNSSESGGVTPDSFDWKWEMTYTADPQQADTGEGKTAAVLADKPEDGESYLIYNEGEGLTLTDSEYNGKLESAALPAAGDRLTGEIPDNAMVVTVTKKENGNLLFKDAKGRFLSCVPAGGLTLSDNESPDGLSEWIQEDARGGCILVNAGRSSAESSKIALELFKDEFMPFAYSDIGCFIFNFYSVKAEG